MAAINRKKKKKKKPIRHFVPSDKLHATAQEVILKRKKRGLNYNKPQNLTTLCGKYRSKEPIEQHNQDALNKIQNVGNYRSKVSSSSTNK